MIRRAAVLNLTLALPLTMALGTAAFPVLAKSPQLEVHLRLTSGSLPPQYAWSTEVAITTDGLVTLKDCKGYETEGDACAISTAQASTQALAELRDAVLTSGLIDTPARETDMPLIGGGSTTAQIQIDGAALTLPAQPAAADAPRVQALLSAIKAAVPAELQPALTKD